MATRRALISVSNKDGIIDFARAIVKKGFEIVSTGGTKSLLKKSGVDCITDVSEVTGFPECLGGRVKTLHPKIHGGILAVRDNQSHMQQINELEITPVDMVVFNLYPFRETVENPSCSFSDAVEQIDIGGPSALRAAAKNYRDVIVIVDSNDYKLVMEELDKGEVSLEVREYLACKVFEHTAAYDAVISEYFRKKLNLNRFPEKLTFSFEKMADMRYGENPHQSAAFYRDSFFDKHSIVNARQLWGKQLSFNNINDASAALEIAREFADEQAAAVAVKHANPCGAALGTTILDAYKKAYDSDPVSIYGGIVVLSRKVDALTAKELSGIFLEIIIAPDYDEDALEILKQKKNLRILKHEVAKSSGGIELKKVGGGVLVQDIDCCGSFDLNVVTKKAPSEAELRDLIFGMKIVKHVKSNAIVLVKNQATVGIGPGQTNRVTSLKIALEYAGEKASGSVMASDAFFPFDDCVTEAAKAGVKSIIQPGGSVRDKDSIEACDKLGISMVFTGVRHFKH